MTTKQLGYPLWALGSLMFLFSCQKEIGVQPNELMLASAKSNPAEKFNVFKGPSVEVGEGHARSWVRINHLGWPEEIGLEISASALNGLPDHHAPFLLPLHKKAQAVTPFDHIGLNYHPQGHFPPGVFSFEHFDAHFYMMTLEERLAMPDITPQTLPLYDLAPPVGYLPANYIPGGPDARMGKHWLPPPPSFMPFTRVMIYGTYNGEVTFVEPMVTTAHLLSGGSSQPYAQPSKFAIAGNYSTIYNVYTDDKGNYQITLSGFVARAAH